jgi:predicted negative regulator of RcsB-dependent stress response
MAVYDLEEQEQLEDLKAWWKQWGNLVTGVIIAAAAGIIGVQGWRWWQGNQAEQASVLYNAVSAAVKANDVAKAKDAIAQLNEKFGTTGYAPRAALLVAKTLFDAGDKAGAKAQLLFVIDRSSEEELKEIARLRLAEVQFDEKQYDDALRTLDAKHDAPFAGVYADLRGDILMAAGRGNEARVAYQTALTKFDTQSPYHAYVEAKLDAAGGPLAGAPGSANPPGSGSAQAPPTGSAPSKASPPATAPANAPAPAK